MAQIPFVKYHGAGNDFIMIDDRTGHIQPLITETWIERVCDRHFGIGADGLIMLQSGSNGADFFMKYYNADGRESTFCGNGGRCIVAFASQLNIHQGECNFSAKDGIHHAKIQGNEIELSMTDVTKIETIDESTYVLFTGSPHYVTFVNNVNDINVTEEGRSIRNSPAFIAEGINVNFLESSGSNKIHIRTYERGVEDETLACGTGVVAAAIANAFRSNDLSNESVVITSGGSLRVHFTRSGNDQFTGIKLIGPAQEIFQGIIEI